MAMERHTLDGPLAPAREALDRGDWAEARERFQAALAKEESGEAWEGLGWAGWWLADAELTISARERAFRAFRDEGADGAAARVAAWLAADFFEFLGDEATGSGWIERAQRLLEGLPESPDHGWVALHRASFLPTGHADDRRRLAALGARLGREHGIPDLEAIGLAQEGAALIVQGEVETGMRRLEEASAIAAGEDLQLPISQGWAACYCVSASEDVCDFPRAAQWCQAMRAFTERWGGRQIVGVCRTTYGRVLATGGDWAAAETELAAAVADLEAARPGMAAGGLVRLGELRARQGRVEEARALLDRAAPDGRALVALGDLALAERDAAAARDAAERVLRRIPETSILGRLPAQELLARAQAALGELEAAARAANSVAEAAEALGTPYLRGRGHLVAGEVAEAGGDHEAARRACEDAVDCFRAGSAPYDLARAQLVLAQALGGLGRREAAEAEARAARDAFAALGAPADVERAEAVLAGGSRGTLGELTARELEVLQLVAQGLSDAEIADRLVVSPHTVHRHVANVRSKLRLPSRAAAVAYAAREGLL
jgi:ATP/maltotriose-dependent transcriptional regulator MalT